MEFTERQNRVGLRGGRETGASGATVGIYSEVIFPRICDFLMDRPFVAKHRQQLLATACGEVLEIGFGTGLNLAHYPAQVRRITTVDPNAGMHRLAQRRVSGRTKRSRARLN